MKNPKWLWDTRTRSSYRQKKSSFATADYLRQVWPSSPVLCALAFRQGGKSAQASTNVAMKQVSIRNGVCHPIGICQGQGQPSKTPKTEPGGVLYSPHSGLTAHEIMEAPSPLATPSSEKEPLKPGPPMQV
ncbi:hypothetical protein BJV82DRAFT_575702 [Fennellomyces sp. T-0311]|nr:hypothetical protein BJV82DRAFT_575702 [Fennellomyces sp. T-0311]